MEPLPALHPIVLKLIASPPFEYSPNGLTFKGHARASVPDLKKWLFPRKNARGKQVKEWWLAQLRLYGVEVKSSAKVADLTESLKHAYANGKIKPSANILALEQQLERRFLLENFEAREKEYASSSDECKAQTDTDRFLKEKFFNGKKEGTLVALEVIDSTKLLHAAKALGLRSAGACGPGNRGWIILGKNERDVEKRKREIERDFVEWEVEHNKVMKKRMREYEEECKRERELEEKEQAAKRQKLELMRQECEAGGKGRFKDVGGEWRIECPDMDKTYRKATRSMSIFFATPSSRRRDYSDDEYYEEDELCSDDEAECRGKRRANIPEAVCSAPMLCANFKMGILEGTLRSGKTLPPESAKFPVAKVSFTWRGYETGEGEIEFDDVDTNSGSFNFLSKTKLEGVLKSSFGAFPFTGCKVSREPVDNRDDKWDHYSAEAHERARVGRW